MRDLERCSGERKRRKGESRAAEGNGRSGFVECRLSQSHLRTEDGGHHSNGGVRKRPLSPQIEAGWSSSLNIVS